MSEGSNARVEDAEAMEPAGLFSPRVMVVSLEEELGLSEMEALGTHLLRLMYSGTRRVVLDFEEVPHVDYRGVRTLVSRAERFREAGGDIKLSGLSAYLRAILRAVGAHEKFDCYASVEQAFAAFPVAAFHGGEALFRERFQR